MDFADKAQGTPGLPRRNERREPLDTADTIGAGPVTSVLAPSLPPDVSTLLDRPADIRIAGPAVPGRHPPARSRPGAESEHESPVRDLVPRWRRRARPAGVPQRRGQRSGANALLVAAATAPSRLNGLARGRASGESPVQTEMNPMPSALRANSTGPAPSCRPVITVSRLGSSTPTRITSSVSTHPIRAPPVNACR